jgi:hypothetical protein
MCINIEYLQNFFANMIDDFENQFNAHEIIVTFNEGNNIFRENIRQTFQAADIQEDVNGAYAIFYNGECLYAGKGAPIINRLIDHNNSAYGRGPDGERVEYHELFHACTHGERLIAKIFICANDNETNRIILKHSLKCIYQPQFWNE